jgi:hypothetical protein
MLEIIDHGNINLLFNIINVPQKCNKMWGAEYILMDSNTFMGGTGPAEYESIIDMFMNIWNVNNLH